MMRMGLGVLVAMLVSGGTVSGKWRGSFRVDGADHEIPQVIVLNEQGKTVTGTGGPDETERYPIARGRVDGNEVKFEITTGEWKFFYDLKESGDSLA
jgi:hypothetical protein